MDARVKRQAAVEGALCLHHQAFSVSETFTVIEAINVLPTE
jgi:hypothetical protein